MTITQPTYPIRTDALVSYLGAYTDDAQAASVITKRVTSNLSSDGYVYAQAFASGIDACQRGLIQLPVTTTRWRLRVRNYGILHQQVNTGAVTFTGVWVGQPSYPTVATSATARWLGLFTSAPTQMLSTFATDSAGDDYTTSWVTGGSNQFVAGQQYGMSLGFNSGGAAINCACELDGLSWQATGSSASGVAGAAAIPSGGTGTDGKFFDIRLEYEFVTPASKGTPVVLFIGDSITYGKVGNDSLGSWPHEAFPGAAALKHGFAPINMGVSSAKASDWVTTAQWMWQRMDLATTVPDACVIFLGRNDILGGGQTAAQTEANLLLILNYIQTTIGVERVYVCTLLPEGLTAAGGETIRTSLNNWLRGVPAGFAGVFDFDKQIMLQAPELTGTASWTPGAITTGAEVSTTVTVTNAVVGQNATAWFSVALPAGVEVTADVTAAGTVTVTMSNNSGSTQTIGAGTINAGCFGTAGMSPDPDFLSIPPHPNRGGYQRMADLVNVPALI